MNTLIVMLALCQSPDFNQLRYEQAYQQRVARQARLANRRNPYYPSSPLSYGMPQPFIIYFPQQQPNYYYPPYYPTYQYGRY